MDTAAEPDVCPEPRSGGKEQHSSGAVSEPIAARVRYLFRQVGDNLPARELEQRLIVYRLKTASP